MSNEKFRIMWRKAIEREITYSDISFPPTVDALKLILSERGLGVSDDDFEYYSL